MESLALTYLGKVLCSSVRVRWEEHDLCQLKTRHTSSVHEDFASIDISLSFVDGIVFTITDIDLDRFWRGRIIYGGSQ